MELQIEGKVFMVAAASKGLGLGIARELAKNCAIVCIASRPSEFYDKKQIYFVKFKLLFIIECGEKPFPKPCNPTPYNLLKIMFFYATFLQ